MKNTEKLDRHIKRVRRILREPDVNKAAREWIEFQRELDEEHNRASQPLSSTVSRVW